MCIYVYIYTYVCVCVLYFKRTPKLSTSATFERSHSQAVPQHMENFTNSTIHSAIHIHVILLLFLLISTTMFSFWKVNVNIKWLCNDSSHSCFAQHINLLSDSSLQALFAVLDLPVSGSSAWRLLLHQRKQLENGIFYNLDSEFFFCHCNLSLFSRFTYSTVYF